MNPSTYKDNTAEELERIDWFKNAGPCLREEMIQTYEIIYGNVEDESIKESCGRITRAMGERDE